MRERKPSRFEIRLAPELEDRIDEWRRSQPDLPTRAEAARRLIEAGLGAIGTRGGPRPGGSTAGSARKPASTAKGAAPRKAPERKAAPSSKLDQIRALREQDAG